MDNLTNDISGYNLDYKIDVVHSTDEKLLANIREGILENPIIGVTITYEKFSDDINIYSGNQISELCEFSVTENAITQKRAYDYINTMPMMISFDLTILTKDISHTVEIENFINEKYCNNRNVSIYVPNNTNEIVNFEITIDNDIDIERSNHKESQMYQSIYTLKCISYVPSFSQSYHPAQIQFNTDLQTNMVNKLNNLCRLHTIFSSINDTSFEKEIKLKGIANAQNSICNTLGIPLSYGQNGRYTNELHRIMVSEKCNINIAIDKLKEQIKNQEEADKKEAERINIAKEKFNIIELPILDYYIDAIVEDFKNRFPSVAVFGGSSFTQFLIEREKSTFKYPCIVIHSNVSFSFSYKTYTNTADDGTLITHTYTPDALPIEYNIKVEVYAREKETVKTIEKDILEIYSNTQLSVKDYKYTNELNKLHLAVESNLKYDMKTEINNEYIPSTYIKFKTFQSVYYTTEYCLSDVENNQRLQARLFQLANFYCECECRMLYSDLKPYKALFAQKSNSGKTLFSKISNGLSNIGNGILTAVQSDEYRELKDKIQNREPIDKTLFDKALIITSIYPNLYDKMVQGWSYEQIEEDMKKYASCFNAKWNKICNLLTTLCPELLTQLEMSGNKNEFSYSIRSGLEYYYNKMIDSPELSISECKKLYDEQLRIEKERMDAAFDAFFSSIHEGVKDSLSDSSRRRKSHSKNEKPDLMGSAGCMYNRRDSSGFKVSCNISCPLFWQCKRGAGS